MLKKEKLLNYFLSIGFILFLTIFLSLMILMSRFVLSEITPVGNHVENTKSLLANIEEVEKAANKMIVNKTSEQISPISIPEKSETLNDFGIKIKDISYFNSKTKQNSVINIVFEGEVGKEDGIYYILLPAKGLIKGDLVAYKSNGITFIGKFVTLFEDTVHIENENDEIIKINSKQILGKIIYNENE